MATPKVDLKLGTAIVPVFDGTQANLSSFIDSVSLFVDNVDAEFAAATADQKAAAKITITKFVTTRLTGKARAAVGNNPADVDQILNSLRTRCGLATSSDVFISKLGALKQTSDINKFTTEVENLTLLLEQAYVTEQIQVDIANKMAVKQGVKALCTGVRNPDTKLILKAGQFTTLSAAIEKTLDNEVTPSTSNANTVMYVARRGHGYRGRGNSYHGYSQRGNSFNNRGGYSNRRGRGNARYFNNSQNSNSQRGGGYQGGSQRGYHRGNNQPRIYYAVGYGQPPQQNAPPQQTLQGMQPAPNQQPQAQRIQQTDNGNFLGHLFSS